VNGMTSHEQALNGMWEGDAKNTFDKAYNQNLIQFENFYKGINEYVKALNQVADEYDRTEAINVQVAK